MLKSVISKGKKRALLKILRNFKRISFAKISREE
jgi:hypothetical protein